MRNRFTFTLILFVTALILVGSIAFSKSGTSSEVELRLLVPGKAFTLGEIVPYEILLKNRGTSRVYVPADVIQEIAIEVSTGSTKQFKRYVGPGRDFSVDGVRPGLEILPQDSQKIRGTIFWNRTPDLSHLNQDRASELVRERILENLVFTEAGEYWIKARMEVRQDSFQNDPGDAQPARVISLESAPVKIVVNKLTGPDLEVWNRIRDNTDIAFFIQEGDLLVPAHKAEARSNLRREIEWIIDEYPKSTIVKQMKSNLRKLDLMEEKMRKAEKRPA